MTVLGSGRRTADLPRAGRWQAVAWTLVASTTVVGTWALRSSVPSAAGGHGALPWRPALDVAAAGLASFLCFRAATRAGNLRARVGWGLQSLACAAWTGAPLGVALNDSGLGVGGQVDAARSCHLALTAAGFLLTARSSDPRARTRMALDGLAAAAAVFIVVWAVILDPLLAAGHGRTLEAVRAMAFPAGAITLGIFYLLLALTEFSPGRRTMPFLFVAGLAAIATADIRYTQLGLLGLTPVARVDSGGWSAGFLTIGLAALSYRGTTRRRTEWVPAWWTTYVPYAMVVAAVATLGVQMATVRRVPGPEAAAAAVIVAVVLVRQLLLVTHNRRLVAALAERERALRHQARHDALTGLANRFLLLERLNEVLEAGATSLSLVLCDLDDFKSVNDTLGHHAGDELLVQVATRLRDAVRASDTVARLGGDEFVVLLDAEPERALQIARQLQVAFQEPFPVAGHQLPLSASFGVAVVPSAARTATSAVELLKSADLAMYEAKRRGKNDVQVFTPAVHRATASTVALRSELAGALERGELVVGYEAVIRTADGVAAWREARPRWVHEQRGAVDARDLVAALGRGRLVGRFSQLVLATVCTDLQRWIEQEHWPGGVAVDLSGPQLVDPELVGDLRRAVAGSGVDPQRLILEIPEPAVVGDLPRAAAVLGELRSFGCRVAVDHFGRAHGALTPLAVLPVDLVKLDRALVTGVDRYREVIRAVVQLTHARGAQVGADGVETAAQLAALVELGCDLAQGPLLGRRGERVLRQLAPEPAGSDPARFRAG